MKTEHAEALSQTFCRVIEQLAFMFAEAAERADLPEPEGECIGVSMNFTGVFAGRLRMAAPAAICAELAGNILGMELDEEQATARGLDSLKELLNVTCGNILTEIAGEEAVFSLSIPEAIKIEADEWENLVGRPETMCFLVDEHPALLELTLEGEGQ